MNSTFSIRNLLISVICMTFFSYFKMIILSAADTACDAGVISNIESHINNIRAFHANFVQINSDSTVQQGVLYMMRPGNLRWEYTAPEHTLILVKNKKATYYDYALEEKSKINLQSTIVDFLVQDKVSLRDLNLQHCDVKNNEYWITVIPSKKDDLDIVLTVILYKNTFMFKEFIIKKLHDNPQSGKKIKIMEDSAMSRIRLTRIHDATKLDDSAFDFATIIRQPIR